MATVRSSLVSRARYTSPMPPAPMGAMISYGPSCVPASSGIVHPEVVNAVEAGVTEESGHVVVPAAGAGAQRHGAWSISRKCICSACVSAPIWPAMVLTSVYAVALDEHGLPCDHRLVVHRRHRDIDESDDWCAVPFRRSGASLSHIVLRSKKHERKD